MPGRKAVALGHFWTGCVRRVPRADLRPWWLCLVVPGRMEWCWWTCARSLGAWRGSGRARSRLLVLRLYPGVGPGPPAFNSVASRTKVTWVRWWVLFWKQKCGVEVPCLGLVPLPQGCGVGGGEQGVQPAGRAAAPLRFPNARHEVHDDCLSELQPKLCPFWVRDGQEYQTGFGKSWDEQWPAGFWCGWFGWRSAGSRARSVWTSR